MLTIKQITDDKEAVIRGLEKKHFQGAREAIDQVLAVDNKRKEAQVQLDSLNAQVNVLSKRIGGLMKEGKKEEAESARQQVAECKQQSRLLEEQMKQAEEERRTLLCAIPNAHHRIIYTHLRTIHGNSRSSLRERKCP